MFSFWYADYLISAKWHDDISPMMVDYSDTICPIAFNFSDGILKISPQMEKK